MEEAGRASPALRRAVSALELEVLESRGELPLLDDAPAAPEPPSAEPPLLPTPAPPPPPVAPPAWTPPLIRQTSKASRSYSRRRGRRTLKGPLRALRLCLLAVLLPGLLVAGPLYLRFHIYADQVYPLAMSDMRLLDGRVSTTWCQRQVVRANATFNAFLLPEQPQVAPEKKSVSMVRDLLLEDDMKEYWAFYLLRGSSITVSACVNHPGASLVVIRGHKHLHDCAYIGDNSSEELDEVAEAEARAAEEAQEAATATAEAVAAAQARAPGGRRSGADAARSAEDASQPAVRRRVRPEVKLLGAHPPLDSKELLAHPHPHEPDPEDGALRHILNKVAQKRAGVGRRRGGGSTEFYKVDGAADSRASATPSPAPPPRRPPPAPAPSLAAGAAPSSSEVFEEVLRKLRALGHRGNAVLRRLNHQLERTSVASEAAAAATAATAHAPPSPPPATAGPATPALTPAPADSASDEDSSPEADTLTDALGEPGAMDALRELVRRLLKEHADETATQAAQAAQAAGGRRRRASPSPHHQHQQHPPDAPHKRRSAHSPEARLAAQRWSADDEEDNVALEVDMRPDGIADHHERVNETEAGDLDSSNSEFWSSFSSSEEALLSCTGLVLNLPLHPHHQCTRTADPGRLHAASTRNTLTYRVPTNGYYFFVFGSENEVQTNYIRAHFHLERVVYNVSSPVASCHNTTQPCALPLDFFSSEKLVLEMPVRPNASLWNEEFLVVSSCEPRTALYVACIVAVPMLIVMFAFQ